MKQLTKAIVVFAVSTILVWLACGFVAWDWNVEEWTPFGMFFIVWLSLAVGGAAAAASWKFEK